MTPYEFAEALAADLATLPLPKFESGSKVLAQVGDIIVDCEGTWVTINNVSEQLVDDRNRHCGSAEVADIQIASAFACAFTADDTGITDPDKLAEVSKQQSRISTILTEFAKAIAANSFPEGTLQGIQYGNTGGLAIVTVSFTASVP